MAAVVFALHQDEMAAHRQAGRIYSRSDGRHAAAIAARDGRARAVAPGIVYDIDRAGQRADIGRKDRGEGDGARARRCGAMAVTSGP